MRQGIGSSSEGLVDGLGCPWDGGLVVLLLGEGVGGWCMRRMRWMMCGRGLDVAGVVAAVAGGGADAEL
jgi:hypothetical protein